MNPMDEEDPWKWMQPYDVCRFGEVILVHWIHLFPLHSFSRFNCISGESVQRSTCRMIAIICYRGPSIYAYVCPARSMEHDHATRMATFG